MALDGFGKAPASRTTNFSGSSHSSASRGGDHRTGDRPGSSPAGRTTSSGSSKGPSPASPAAGSNKGVSGIGAGLSSPGFASRSFAASLSKSPESNRPTVSRNFAASLSGSPERDNIRDVSTGGRLSSGLPGLLAGISRMSDYRPSTSETLSPYDFDIAARTALGEQFLDRPGVYGIPELQTGINRYEEALARPKGLSSYFKGDTPSLAGVFQAPNQYSAWNPNIRPSLSQMEAEVSSPEYQKALAGVQLALGTPDQVRGATHYYNPSAADPAWKSDLTNTSKIEGHTFGTATPFTGENTPSAAQLKAAVDQALASGKSIGVGAGMSAPSYPSSATEAVKELGEINKSGGMTKGLTKGLAEYMSKPNEKTNFSSISTSSPDVSAQLQSVLTGSAVYPDTLPTTNIEIAGGPKSDIIAGPVKPTPPLSQELQSLIDRHPDLSHHFNNAAPEPFKPTIDNVLDTETPGNRELKGFSSLAPELETEVAAPFQSTITGKPDYLGANFQPTVASKPNPPASFISPVATPPAAPTLQDMRADLPPKAAAAYAAAKPVTTPAEAPPNSYAKTTIFGVPPESFSVVPGTQEIIGGSFTIPGKTLKDNGIQPGFKMNMGIAMGKKMGVIPKDAEITFNKDGSVTVKSKTPFSITPNQMAKLNNLIPGDDISLTDVANGVYNLGIPDLTIRNSPEGVKMGGLSLKTPDQINITQGQRVEPNWAGAGPVTPPSVTPVSPSAREPSTPALNTPAPSDSPVTPGPFSPVAEPAIKPFNPNLPPIPAPAPPDIGPFNPNLSIHPETPSTPAPSPAPSPSIAKPTDIIPEGMRKSIANREQLDRILNREGNRGAEWFDRLLNHIGNITPHLGIVPENPSAESVPEIDYLDLIRASYGLT